MPLVGQTFDNQKVFSDKDALLYDRLGCFRNTVIPGYKNECILSVNGFSITIETGAFLINGRLIEITSPETLVCSPNFEGFLCITINLNQDNEVLEGLEDIDSYKAEILQVKTEILGETSEDKTANIYNFPLIKIITNNNGIQSLVALDATKRGKNQDLMPRINGMLLTKDADIKTMQSLRSDYIYFKDKLYFEMPENSSLNFTYLQDSYLTELQIKDTLVNLDGKRAWGRLLGESSNFVDISSKIVSNNFEVADFLYAKKTRTGLVILGSVINKNTLLNADGIHENNKLVEGISDTLDLLGVRTMNETASTSEPYYFSYLIFCKDTNQANNFSSLYLAPENNYNIPSGTKHLLNAFFPLPNDLFGENFEIV